MKIASSPARLLFCAFVVLIGGSFVAAVPEADSPSQSEAPPDALAAAQPQRIFVASYGKDANNGSRGAPKRTFQAAHNAVAADGEIVVIDTAVYGTLAITKGLTVLTSPGAHGIISVNGAGNGIDIINAPSNTGVILRGLVLEGGGQGAGGVGIRASNALYLVVEDCSIRSFARGIFQDTPGNATSLTNCVLLGCAIGLYLDRAPGLGVSANVNHCRFELNGGAGLYLLNENAGASLTATVGDSTFYRNAAGIYTNRSGGTTAAACTVLVSNSVITANNTGIQGSGSSSEGLVLSRGNNTLINNANSNEFGGTYGAK